METKTTKLAKPRSRERVTIRAEAFRKIASALRELNRNDARTTLQAANICYFGRAA